MDDQQTVSRTESILIVDDTPLGLPSLTIFDSLHCISSQSVLNYPKGC
jgi:hypothetical protein